MFLGADSLSRGQDFHRSDMSGEIEVISVLRILTALEDSLGSLGPYVNKILARSLALEQEYYSSLILTNLLLRILFIVKYCDQGFSHNDTSTDFKLSMNLNPVIH